MLKRYSREILRKIWSEEKKYKTWLDVELYAVEAYSKFNQKITQDDIKKLWKNSKINLKRIEEIEAETHHDVIAFTRQISETLGPEKRWIHYGLTSTDVVDTAQSCRLKMVNDILRDDLKRMISTLKNMAIKYKNVYQIGRTHGIHAEVSTFGYKIALWFDEMNRNLKRFDDAAKQIEVAKISGAVGNYANIPLEIQDYVANKLGLMSSNISTQTLQRDRHAYYLSVLSLISSSLDKFAIELRHLQRTEVSEVQEGFLKGQKGSSAMPHKKNPISSENISGLSRVMKGYALAALENVPLWHERDISHSSSERIILADATSTLDYMLNRFNNVLLNIGINEKQMKKNIFITNGVIFSQKAMLILIDEKNYSREDAYDTIQPITIEAYENDIDFGDLLMKKNILNQSQVDDLYDLSYYTKNIDKVFKRLSLL